MFASIETMTREEVIESVRSMLTRAQFEVSNPLSMRGTRFDIIARRDEILIIIKVLSNVDAFSKDNAEELLCIGQALGASPILVGERSGSGEIEAGIIYSRFGIPIISVETLPLPADSMSKSTVNLCIRSARKGIFHSEPWRRLPGFPDVPFRCMKAAWGP